MSPTTLAAEAYTNLAGKVIAATPTKVERGQVTFDCGAASSSLFCFDNQVSSLLDEELALVRGRDCLANPDGHASPAPI